MIMHFNTFSNQTATIVSTDLCKCASCCQLVHAVNKLCCNQIFGTQLGILAGLALVDLNNGHKTIRVAVSRLLCVFSSCSRRECLGISSTGCFYRPHVCLSSNQHGLSTEEKI